VADTQVCHYIKTSEKSHPDVIPANPLSGNLAANELSRRFPIKLFGMTVDAVLGMK
jgi:hypothetical protein